MMVVLALDLVHHHMPSNSDTLLKRLSKYSWLFFSLILFLGSGTLSSAYAGQGRDEAMQFAPYDYSPYQAERSWAPQPKAQTTVPYNQPQQQPAIVAPPVKRPYEMLSPSGRGYYPYAQPYAGRAYPGGGSGGYGGYPSWGSSMWPGSGGMGGMPWGGGSMPWGGSPGRSSFGWPGSPGGFPFGW